MMIYSRPPWKGKKPYYQKFWNIDGVIYQWWGWFGCQLMSTEWRKPEVGTRRRIGDIIMGEQVFEIEIWDVKRISWFQYQCLWALPQTTGYDEYGQMIHKFQNALNKL